VSNKQQQNARRYNRPEAHARLLMRNTLDGRKTPHMPSLINLIPRRYLAAQLRRPSGLVGRFVVAPMLNRRNAVLNDVVLKSLELDATDRVLEIGFGGGDLMSRVLPLISAGHLIGADFSQDMVDLCARRFASASASGTLELMCASVDELPLADGAVNKACTANTIYFWNDPAAAAAELHRVIARGGRLVIGFAPRESLEHLPVTQHGFAMYEPEDVRSLLLGAGFDEVTITTVEDPDGDDCCATAFK
jgi:arsenite methyltransferase